jgi:hypothetical protein
MPVEDHVDAYSRFNRYNVLSPSPRCAAERNVEPAKHGARVPLLALQSKAFFARRANQSFGCPVLARKIFRLTRRANQPYNSRHPVPHRGAYRDRHGRRARDAMDADAP